MCSALYGIFLDQDSNLSPELTDRFFTTESPGKPILGFFFKHQNKVEMIEFQLIRSILLIVFSMLFCLTKSHRTHFITGTKNSIQRLKQKYSLLVHIKKSISNHDFRPDEVQGQISVIRCISWLSFHNVASTLKLSGDPRNFQLSNERKSNIRIQFSFSSLICLESSASCCAVSVTMIEQVN